MQVMLLGILLVASVSCSVNINIGKGYHKEIGIPLAKKIKAEEEGLLLSRKQRSAGGEIAPLYAHPYLAGLLIHLVDSVARSVCSASLLNHQRLVTAAHCWKDGHKTPSHLIVVLGSNKLFSGGFRIRTTTVITHPKFNPGDIHDDIAMIYLPLGPRLTLKIQPISLPSRWDLNNSFVGQWAVVAGFGKTSERNFHVITLPRGWDLNKSFEEQWATFAELGKVESGRQKNHKSGKISNVDVRVISNEECQQYVSNNLTDSNLCTSGDNFVGVCSGDSGGPLFIKEKDGKKILIGITSNGADNACEMGFPSIYQRVTSLYDFISKHLTNSA